MGSKEKDRERRRRYIEKQEEQGLYQIPRVRIRLQKGEEMRKFAEGIKHLNKKQLKRIVVNDWLSIILRKMPYTHIGRKEVNLIRTKLKEVGVTLTYQETARAIKNYFKQTDFLTSRTGW